VWDGFGRLGMKGNTVGVMGSHDERIGDLSAFLFHLNERCER